MVLRLKVGGTSMLALGIGLIDLESFGAINSNENAGTGSWLGRKPVKMILEMITFK